MWEQEILQRAKQSRKTLTKHYNLAGCWITSILPSQSEFDCLLKSDSQFIKLEFCSLSSQGVQRSCRHQPTYELPRTRARL